VNPHAGTVILGGFEGVEKQASERRWTGAGVRSTNLDRTGRRDRFAFRPGDRSEAGLNDESEDHE
jgi:hypothetical protein